MKRMLRPIPFLLLLMAFMADCSPSFTTRKHASRQWVKTDRVLSTQTTTAQAYELETESTVEVADMPETTGEVTANAAPEKPFVAEGSGQSEVKPDVKKETKLKLERRQVKKSRAKLDKDIKINSTTWLAYGITSFVLGILACGLIMLAIFTQFFVIFTIIGLALGILAVVFGILGLKGKRLRFLTFIGLILGGIAVIAFIVLIIIYATGGL